MAKLLTKAYFNKHPLQEISAARLAYSMMLEQDFEKMFMRTLKEIGYKNESYAAILREVEAVDDLKSMLRYARREIPLDSQLLLRKKLLEREEEALLQIQKMILTSALDIFIDHAIWFFVHCKFNPVSWLLENYKSIRNPYARSMMCLVLGFRADTTVVPFLMQQVDFFEKNYSDESFSQAPLLALHEIQVRFETV